MFITLFVFIIELIEIEVVQLQLMSFNQHYQMVIMDILSCFKIFIMFSLQKVYLIMDFHM